jgi:hypothetical protein
MCAMGEVATDSKVKSLAGMSRIETNLKQKPCGVQVNRHQFN